MDQDRLKQLVKYSPFTGFFTSLKTGQRYRYYNDDGYLQIMLDGRRYRAGRLAWLYMNGEFPPSGMYIDHINRDRRDDRIGNLRLVTPSQNSLNRNVPKKDLPTGVCFSPRKGYTKPYRAQITRDGVYREGRYKTAKEAEKAYLMWDTATP